MEPKRKKAPTRKLYLVYEDNADTDAEITAPSVARRAGYIRMNATILVSAYSAEAAINMCAAEAMFNITGPSRLVAVEFRKFFAAEVAPKDRPQPCDVIKKGVPYPTDE